MTLNGDSGRVLACECGLTIGGYPYGVFGTEQRASMLGPR
jgi:hypothetical protein